MPAVQASSDATDAAAAEAAPGRAQWMILVAIIAVYAALSYYSDAVPEAANLATSLSFAPLVLVAMALVWRWTRPIVAWLVLAGACYLLFRYWAFFRSNYQWSNLAQQAGAYALVAYGFARSLSGDGPPLCTQLADKLHGPLAPEEVAYTRRATVAWTAFYALLTAAIVVLFFATTTHAWSLFVNFGTFALIGLMFLIDHGIRFKVLPNSARRRGVLSALRQFLIGG
jgi:uncharacterized membrane protein